MRALTVPSRSAADIVRLIVAPVGVDVADSENLTVGGLSFIVFVAPAL